MVKQRADRREIRRKEAEERQVLWNALSTKEQIKRLENRPGMCKRQLERLAKKSV